MTVNIGSGEISKIRLVEQGSAPATPATGYGYLYEKTDGKLYFKDAAGNEYNLTVNAAGDAGYTQGARVYNSGNIATTTGTPATLTFDSERYDTDTIHSTVSNTSRLTCQTAGKYHIFGHVEIATNTSGYRRLILMLNGATNIANVILPPASGIQTILEINTIYDLSVSDYVELVVVQTGGSLNVLAAGNRSPEFGMQRVG